MANVALAVHAMATRFELVLHGEDPVHLRAAGEEALGEIERLESQLSLFRPESEIAHLNARAAREPIQVSPEVFGLLEHAQRLHAESGGAFDITIAPLVRCWGFMGSSGRRPSAEELAQAREKVGMNLVELNGEERTVRFSREGVMLDLGAIGKGYAVERAIEVLRDAAVTSALLHGGTSTVYGLGRPPEGDQWLVAIEGPKTGHSGHPGEALSKAPEAGSALAMVPLKDEALSVSAVWGKSFQEDGKEYGHVLDPRTGQPVADSLLAAVVLPSATETDALSTALLTRGAEGHETIANLRTGMKTLLVAKVGDELKVEARNMPSGLSRK
jgi:thiamine biosynthesis lipoprotein